jgi:hypothetical protein
MRWGFLVFAVRQAARGRSAAVGGDQPAQLVDVATVAVDARRGRADRVQLAAHTDKHEQPTEEKAETRIRIGMLVHALIVVTRSRT